MTFALRYEGRNATCATFRKRLQPDQQHTAPSLPALITLQSSDCFIFEIEYPTDALKLPFIHSYGLPLTSDASFYTQLRIVSYALVLYNHSVQSSDIIWGIDRT